MLILRSTGPGTEEREECVAVFGVGLIGMGIVRALTARRRMIVKRYPFNWEVASSRSSVLLDVESELAEDVRRGRRITFVWSAGRAGFLSNEEEMERELAAFSDVLSMAERTFEDVRARGAFHLVSSAGGLFEGQRHVTRSSPVAPKRPYGVLKLQEERRLSEAAAIPTRRIYRVTSAYGYVRRGVRAGLIATLLSDGIRGRVTHLTGRTTTLRDFVFTDDVGSFMTEQILSARERGSETVILARTRPCSLLEVQHSVETVIHRKLYVSYSTEPDNSADITFAAEVVPRGWHPSDLRSNIGTIYRQALQGGVFAEGPPLERGL